MGAKSAQPFAGLQNTRPTNVLESVEQIIKNRRNIWKRQGPFGLQNSLWRYAFASIPAIGALNKKRIMVHFYGGSKPDLSPNNFLYIFP